MPMNIQSISLFDQIITIMPKLDAIITTTSSEIPLIIKNHNLTNPIKMAFLEFSKKLKLLKPSSKLEQIQTTSLCANHELQPRNPLNTTQTVFLYFVTENGIFILKIKKPYFSVKIAD